MTAIRRVSGIDAQSKVTLCTLEYCKDDWFISYRSCQTEICLERQSGNLSVSIHFHFLSLSFRYVTFTPLAQYKPNHILPVINKLSGSLHFLLNACLQQLQTTTLTESPLCLTCGNEGNEHQQDNLLEKHWGTVMSPRSGAWHSIPQIYSRANDQSQRDRHPNTGVHTLARRTLSNQCIMHNRFRSLKKEDSAVLQTSINGLVHQAHITYTLLTPPLTSSADRQNSWDACHLALHMLQLLVLNIATLDSAPFCSSARTKTWSLNREVVMSRVSRG